MSVLGKFVKGIVVGTAVGGYGLYKAAEGAVQKQVDMAKMEELLDREAHYNDEVKHFSDKEREKMLAMAKNFSMVQMAKRSANDKNELNRLKFKYGLIGGKSQPQVETK